MGVLFLSLFCYALRCVHSSFAIILKRKRKLCFAIIVLQMYCFYKCSVALPHGTMVWSAVCYCGTSLSYSIRLGFNRWISFASVLSCMYFDSLSLFYLRLYPELYVLGDEVSIR